jgi:conjugative transfer signal peptidase TraF
MGLAAIQQTVATMGQRLAINITASVPRGLYLLTPAAFAKRGQLVLFDIPSDVRDILYSRRYVPTTVHQLIKHVAATDGDFVCHRNGGVFINGDIVALIRANDSDGNALPFNPFCRRLSSTELYVLAPDPRSFDSRYFGPLGARVLRGRLAPIVTIDAARDEPFARTQAERRRALSNDPR